ncbi:exodeoxyribonuclease I [Vibrio breoganii]|uniref:exodeoxyribonuclease I n=1 Tax=Vibrio breoganii TaxID=553239 RepID=UPI000C85E6B1|nr:exodeoxyribonuclease I [Vibrio breoganii]PMG93566.1 exodeoxyribonuclease I [Vibrio breoganii]PMH17703.1 exodeoxyribonuclease I [Vibrio breoganii]PMK52477.1 exodeoxyribonuclease I [Vibrio breoganii]PMK75037.1 exodeoxyribonuclease I [Vibrio breoganii]PML28174.1 exodeoxyribonuclease I [Vibrio breoganii]
MHTDQPTFFFFDYETWGVSPAKDRPCQFAGVRTDADLNVIGEPLVIYCRPPADYLPNPEAALVTGITPQKAMKEGLSEPEFITAIHNEMSRPNTCTLGYNSVRFDDEVTRYTCYRNFIEPYEWSYKNGNSRWDLLDVMRACHALRPEGVNWPENDEGNTSFRLEHLSVANGIEHSNAHDAMADVYATIEMAKKVKQSQPKLFDFFYKHRGKQKLNALVDIVNMTPLVHVSGMLSTEHQKTALIAPIGWTPIKALITIDLTQDITPLIELSADEIKDRLYTKRSDLEEGQLPIPVKLVHLNKCPILAPLGVLTADAIERTQIDKEECLRRQQLLQQHPQIREKLDAVFAENREFPTSPNIEEQLYNGFFSPSDKAQMRIIRDAKPEVLGSLDIQVTDPRIAPLLFNYRARNFFHTLTDKEQKRWLLHCRDKFEQELPNYMLNLENLGAQHQGDEHKMKILKAIYHYVEQLVS